MIFFAIVFVLGLVFGSFLNAWIYRLEQEKSVVRGRSYCPKCKHQLAWYDLVPLVSFVWLRGKCRYCGQEISWQYPLVELATGVLFVVIFTVGFSTFQQFSDFFIFETLYLFTITGLLIVLFVYDVKHSILPDKILLPAIAVSGIWYFVSNIFFHSYTTYEILTTLYAALGAAAFFLAIFLLSRGRAMGFGDVKLALFMGLFLGWPGIVVAFFVAFVSGGLVGVWLLVRKKKRMKSEIPFGPFLIAGTAIAFFVGENLFVWYTSLIGL